MKDQDYNLSWKTAVVVGAVAATTLVGVGYYLNSRKRFEPAKSLNIDEHNAAILSEIEQLDPKQEVIRLKNKGNVCFKAGRYENALECYTEALNICPIESKQVKAILYQNRAVTLDKLKRLEEALLDLDVALSLQPRYEKALIRRSKIYEVMGRYRDSLIDVLAAVTFNKFLKMELIIRIEKIISNIFKLEVEKQLASPPILQSDQFIKSFLEGFPSDPFLKDEKESGDSSQQIISNCIELLKNVKYQECLDITKKALSSTLGISDEVLSRLHLLRGTFYMLSCREELALADFDLVIKNSCARPSVTINALIKRAMIDLLNNNVSGAERAFAEALRIDPKCPDIYFHRGLHSEVIEDLPKAINDYDRALEIYPRYSYAALNRVFCQFQQHDKNCRKSFYDLDTLMKRFPNFAESNISEQVHRYHIECKQANLKTESYFDKLRSLQTQYPTFAEIPLLLIKAFVSRKKFDEAEQFYASLKLSERKYASIMFWMASIKISKNKDSEAIEILMNAIKCDQRHAESYKLLADIYIRNKDLEKAIDYLDSAIKFAKNQHEVREYVKLREKILIQVNLSKKFDISLTDVLSGGLYPL